jgi:hypothetical protein
MISSESRQRQNKIETIETYLNQIQDIDTEIQFGLDLEYLTEKDLEKKINLLKEAQDFALRYHDKQNRKATIEQVALESKINDLQITLSYTVDETERTLLTANIIEQESRLNASKLEAVRSSMFKQKVSDMLSRISTLVVTGVTASPLVAFAQEPQTTNKVRHPVEFNGKGRLLDNNINQVQVPTKSNLLQQKVEELSPSAAPIPTVQPSIPLENPAKVTPDAYVPKDTAASELLPDTLPEIKPILPAIKEVAAPKKSHLEVPPLINASPIKPSPVYGFDEQESVENVNSRVEPELSTVDDTPFSSSSESLQEIQPALFDPAVHTTPPQLDPITNLQQAQAQLNGYHQDTPQADRSLKAQVGINQLHGAYVKVEYSGTFGEGKELKKNPIADNDTNPKTIKQ